MRRGAALRLSIALALAACGRAPGAPGAADIVFHGATVITMDEELPTADAVAIAGEHIVGVGSLADLRSLVGPETQLVDVSGTTIIPGINETHIHVRDLGFEQRTAVNLQPARNVADVQRLLRERLAELEREGRLGGWRYPPTGQVGPWLFGLAWTQDRLEERRMADRRELDAVSRDVPISLDRIYNGIAVNTRVFELLGIDFDNPATYPDWFRRDPPDFEAGDIIFRDPDTGLPNGVFMGTKAPLLVAPVIPEKTFEQTVESLVLGLEYLASLGITAVVEAGSRMGEVTRQYQAAYTAGRLPIRAVLYDGWYRSGDPDGIGDPARIRERLGALGFNNLGDHRFRVRGAKSSEDGGLGARSATVSAPYLPVPGDPLGARNRGMLREPDLARRSEQLRVLAEFGWELHVHAIGDVAIRRVVDIYKVLMDSIHAVRPDADLRWSIIHAYLPDEPGTSVIRDLADYGIIAAINPANLYYEGDSFVRNVGPERMTRHTPFRTFLEAGIRMASGSDYPNNSPDPWAGIYAMMTREIETSGEVHGPEQRIPFLDALRTFTLNGAYLTYDEDVRGSLEPGKLADLVVVDANLLEGAPAEILEMASRVLVTMVGGEIVYRRPDSEF
ncbi:MAG: amidohydrolase [Gemmatimonadetes bacterium]|nr:amidohydrolase [Gemmatimonadota bacterium]